MSIQGTVVNNAGYKLSAVYLQLGKSPISKCNLILNNTVLLHWKYLLHKKDGDQSIPGDKPYI